MGYNFTQSELIQAINALQSAWHDLYGYDSPEFSQILPAYDGIIFHMADGETFKWFRMEECGKRRVGDWRNGHWERV